MLWQTQILCNALNHSNQQPTQGKECQKRRVLYPNDGTSVTDKKRIIKEVKSFYNNGLYNWNEKDFGVELNTKRGHNVY